MLIGVDLMIRGVAPYLSLLFAVENLIKYLKLKLGPWMPAVKILIKYFNLKFSISNVKWTWKEFSDKLGSY